jgi:hypothetical protein
MTTIEKIVVIYTDSFWNRNKRITYKMEPSKIKTIAIAV